MSNSVGVNAPAAARGGLGSGADAVHDVRDVGAAGPWTILVADDDLAVRSLIGDVLLSQGFNVLHAADGEEALEVAAQHPGPIHLLLTDVVMPRLDGLALHRRMSSDRPGTTTLFMSGSLDPGQQQLDAFLPKPFTVSALIHKVTEVLEARTGSLHSLSAPQMHGTPE